MKYVLGIDLGTSSVKVLLMNANGVIVDTHTEEYPIYHEKPGHSEQNPIDWVEKTIVAIKIIVSRFTADVSNIVGISYSGQMHGLVILDKKDQVLRPAILWNDTRTTSQCQRITEIIGEPALLRITKNRALEGFTLPKLLWVQEQEPAIFEQINVFLLPKDYLRFAMTGQYHMDYSDAAGTLMMDIEKKVWSTEIAKKLTINLAIYPSLVSSAQKVGTLTKIFAEATGLSYKTQIFAGGADNACGALGSGIFKEGKTMVSIGTSGVLLTYEATGHKNYNGKVHYFNHVIEDAFYSMGVTLSAGHSLSWYKNQFMGEESFESIMGKIKNIPLGSQGILYAPYLVGERTPYADATIRGSFIGIDAAHTKYHLFHAVMEGIVFSLRDSLEIFKASGQQITEIFAIGGGSKNDYWLQMQADIFNAQIFQLENEQGPGIGACLIAAVGTNIFPSFEHAVSKVIHVEKIFIPNKERVEQYNKLYTIYKQLYGATCSLSKQLNAYH